MPSSRFRTPRRRLLNTTVTAAAAALALPLALTAPAHAAAPGASPSPSASASPSTSASPTASPTASPGTSPSTTHTAPQPRTAAPRGTARPMLPGGTVEQALGPVEVVGGGPLSHSAWFNATLPASATGTVHAAIVFNGAFFGAGDTAVALSAEHLHAVCAIDDASLQPCAWHGDNYDETDPYRGNVWLSLPPAPAGTHLSYHVRISSDFGLFSEDTLLTGWIELTGDDGTPLADGPAQIQYRRGVQPAWARSALYGRDASGVLWRYEGNDRATGAAPFEPRARVGGGWNAYTAITPLTTPTAAATGDMVARDKDGVLWYYRHSGIPDQPFQPRKRVGGGWNVYTAVAGVGHTAVRGLDSSVGDLVARDRSGVLWWYRATGDADRPFAPRVRVGGGWNAYTAIVETQNGLLARDSSGVLWEYVPWGLDSGPFAPRMRVGGGWNAYTALADTCSGLGLYGNSGLVARDRAGKLWLYESQWSGPTTRTLVGGGWNVYTMLF